MTLYEYYIVFPGGEMQETGGPLPIGELIDINGTVLHQPLPTNKMIAYQIAGKRTLEERGTVKTVYILSQLNAQELTAYTV